MNIVAIVQARMSSSRLPNKVLLPLAGKPVLGHVVERLQHCERLNKIVVATSTDFSDDAITKWCLRNNINYYRGSLLDVLDRYYQAAFIYQADVVVRITADCPMIDPIIVDEVIEGFLAGDYDAYSLSGDFPDGLDCQVFRFDAIAKAWKGATLPSEREHVGPYIEKTHPELFRLGGLEKFTGLAHHRWTLDEPQDYEFLKEIFSKLYKKNKPFYAEDVLFLLGKEPKLMQINSGIIRNEGYLKSINSESV